MTINVVQTVWGTQKVSNPEKVEHLRIISLTAKFSKTFENLVIKWMYKYIGHNLDPQQFGGRKGRSITHDIIKLLPSSVSTSTTTITVCK